MIIGAGLTAAAEVLAGVGFAFTMLARLGLIMASRSKALVISVINATPRGEVRLDTAGRIIAELTKHHEAAVTPQDLGPRMAGMVARLDRLLGVNIVPAEVALAYRPVPGGGLPAVGAVIPGLWMAVMHSGVTLAPVVAEPLAQQGMGSAADPLLAPFGLKRFRG